MKRSTMTDILSALLILLWTYAAFSKLLAYQTSRQQMINQVFPHFIAIQLTWIVPVVEIGVAILLLINTMRNRGLLASAILLIAFSFYISITMTGAFGKTPCSCGGIITSFTYWQHLLFNLIFLAINFIALNLNQPNLETNEERRPVKIS